MITDFLNRLTMGRAILIGIFLAAFYYVIVFDSGTVQQGQIQANQAKIDELKNLIQENQKKLDRAAVYKKTASEVGSTINKLLSLVPEKFGMSDLMRIVSNEAKIAGLSLDKIEPKTTKISPVAPEFEEMTVSVDVSGSFLQLMVFLSNLTKIQQIVIANSLDFSHLRDGKGDEPPAVGLKGQIIAYRYRGSEVKK